MGPNAMFYPLSESRDQVAGTGLEDLSSGQMKLWILYVGSASRCWLKSKAEAVWKADCLGSRKSHFILSSLMNEVSMAWEGEEGCSHLLTHRHCLPMETPLKTAWRKSLASASGKRRKAKWEVD